MIIEDCSVIVSVKTKVVASRQETALTKSWGRGHEIRLEWLLEPDLKQQQQVQSMVFGPSWLLGHCTSANKSPKGIHTKRNITQQGSAVWPDQPHCMTQQSKGKCSPWLSGLCGRGDTTPLPQEPKGTIITCNSNKPHRSFSCSVVRLVNKQPVYCPFLWHTRGKHMLSLQWSSKTKQDF